VTLWQGAVLGLLIAIVFELMAIFAAVFAHYVRHKDD
jgi:ABC-type nickel/cobalt efflux system permease component RcnA